MNVIVYANGGVTLNTELYMAAGGGSATERDGGDRAGVRGHAGAEFQIDTAAAREGRRELQADDGEDQEQSVAQARAGGEGRAEGASVHIDDASGGGQCRRA